MKNINRSVTGLHQKVEDSSIVNSLETGLQLSNIEMEVLIRGLQSHQIELEKQNEELIVAKEQAEIASVKYGELFDFAPLGYFVLSKEGEIVELNHCGSLMLGKERMHLKNSSFGFFVSDDTKPIFNRFLGDVFSNKAEESCEVTLSVNGHKIDVCLNGIAFEHEEQCYVTVIDFTKRKAVEIALAESRELYADLVSNQSVGIFRINVKKQEIGKSIIESTSFEFMSDRFCEIFEIGRSEFEEENIASAFSKINASDKQGFIDSIEAAQQSLEPYHREVRLLIGNQIKWVRIECSPRMLEDGSTRWTSAVLDITVQKLAEESIRINEERYRMLIELANDAFFQGDTYGNFIVVNSTAINLTGFSRDELLKMNMKDLFLEQTLLEKPLKFDLLRKGEQAFTERELVRKDKELVTVEMSSRMMPDGTFQSFFRDITQRKRIEKDLKRKLSELEIYYELAITRERKMIALKSEINLLLERLGEKLKY